MMGVGLEIGVKRVRMLKNRYMIEAMRYFRRLGADTAKGQELAISLMVCKVRHDPYVCRSSYTY